MVTGDATVPARSATQGTPGTRDPYGDDIPIAYVCGVDHVPLPGSDAVMDAFGDFMRWGTPPRKSGAPCPVPPGTQFEIRKVDVEPENAKSPVGGLPPKALKQLLAADGPELQVVPLRRSTLVVATDGAASATFMARSVRVTARRFGADGRPGVARSFGVLTGRLEIGVAGKGRPRVRLDGRRQRPSG
jgi:hypothetical protein